MRSRRARAPIAGLLSAAVCAAGLASCTSTLGYAALVNGGAISQSSINQQLADINVNKAYVQMIDQPGGQGPVQGPTAGTYNKSFVAVLLDQQVRFEVIHQTLVADKALPNTAGLTNAKAEVMQAFQAGVFTAFPSRYQSLLVSQQAEADAFVTDVTKNMTASDLSAFYQAHLGDYATGACVRHILIADKDASGALDYTASLTDAQKVLAMINGGADFAAMAKQYSQDNQGANGGSAAAGGVLAGSGPNSCLTTSDLQQVATDFGTDFVNAVLGQPVNQASNPVKSPFGYSLIEVTSRTVEPLDATVTQDIQRRLAGVDLNNLVAKAKVKVNPEFGSFNNKPDATGVIPGVMPPVVPGLGTTTTTAVVSGAATGTAGTAATSGTPAGG